MRHCSNAVPISKVVKGHMGQAPHKILSNNQSKVNEISPNRTYKGRIVTTSHTFNGVSTNWKRMYTSIRIILMPRWSNAPDVGTY